MKLNTRTRDAILKQLESGTEDPFIVVDLDDVDYKTKFWSKMLPRVRPFYAVKCNPDEQIIKSMIDRDLGFDCASKREIETVLRLGGKPEDIVYANPCKQPSHIKFARERGVALMTFDNADEILKVKKIYPEAKLLLRIITDDSHSVCRLSQKFGADMEEVPRLLKLCKEMDMDVVGFSYHVGSGCKDETSFVDALKRAYKAYNIAKKMGIDVKILDIGGGFPGTREDLSDGSLSPADLTFSTIARKIGPLLDELFPADSGIQLIAEPGRFFVHSCATTMTNIIGRRVSGQDLNALRDDSCDSIPSEVSTEEENSDYSGSELKIDSGLQIDVAEPKIFHSKYMYYINEGLYSSFNCVLYDHQVMVPQILKADGREVSLDDAMLEKFDSSIWGPTCDGLDCVLKHVRLPELQIGDWIYFANSGAYTSAAGSQFNGFERAEVIYVD